LASGGALLSLAIGVLLGFERMDSDSFQLFADDNIGQFFTFFRVELVFGAVLPMLIGIAYCSRADTGRCAIDCFCSRCIVWFVVLVGRHRDG